MLNQNIFQRLQSTHPCEGPEVVCHLAASHLTGAGQSTGQPGLGLGKKDDDRPVFFCGRSKGGGMEEDVGVQAKAEAGMSP